MRRAFIASFVIAASVLAAACTDTPEFTSERHVLTPEVDSSTAPESLGVFVEPNVVQRGSESNEGPRVVRRLGNAPGAADGEASIEGTRPSAPGSSSEWWLSDWWLDMEVSSDANVATLAAAAKPPALPSIQPSRTPRSPSDPMLLYTGVLGRLAIDEVLAATTSPFPVTRPGIAPLTGVAGGVAKRPAVVVKIDNSSKARPQAGLNLADVIVEQEVEWGLTRLAAIFHSREVPVVGPVRSARSTDISFLNSLGQPALVYSGANAVFDELIRRLPGVQNFSAARNGGYWRDSSRRAPSNLYADTRTFDDSGGSPPAWFDYAASPVTNGSATSTFAVTFPNTKITWDWDGSQWLRRQDGKRHTTDGGSQVAAQNIVVAQVRVVDSGLVDPAGSVVPEFVWAGEGRVSVFTNGRRIDGSWVRPTLADPAVLVDDAGNVIELTPGITWVELVRNLP